MICTCTIDTPLGGMRAAAKDDALIGLWFIGQKYYPLETAKWHAEAVHPVFEMLRLYLSLYFSNQSVCSDVPLDPAGSTFQKKVWDLLLKIPKGQVATYGQIAGYIARTEGLAAMSAQAVGGAVGHNPIAILIPCHRVVGANRSLTGYAGGMDKKSALLRIENVDLATIDLRRSPFDPMKSPRRSEP